MKIKDALDVSLLGLSWGVDEDHEDCRCHNRQRNNPEPVRRLNAHRTLSDRSPLKRGKSGASYLVLTNYVFEQQIPSRQKQDIARGKDLEPLRESIKSQPGECGVACLNPGNQ